MWIRTTFLLLLMTGLVSAAAKPSLLVKGARSCLGDVYDSSEYRGGPPPRGRGACTDVVYWACKASGLDLQAALDADLKAHPQLYPSRRSRDIDYRWAPDLIVYFHRFHQQLTSRLNPLTVKAWKPGDVIFWSLAGDGVADHCGVISDQKSLLGWPMVIHNGAPRCVEEPIPPIFQIVGHYRVK